MANGGEVRAVYLLCRQFVIIQNMALKLQWMRDNQSKMVTNGVSSLLGMLLNPCTNSIWESYRTSWPTQILESYFSIVWG